ncbi:MAG: peptide-methionine (S)-S-oxide reductase MsrA [Saprospiraceae bacterium]|nr:peptide-methionine (S)-S-oxide reductase MsrA [Saprospiraceae bacterium]
MELDTTNIENLSNTDTAIFGGGCFWCLEAVFQDLKGVLEVTSGYMGGMIKNPSYKEVCKGTTGHAEVVRIIYNPQLISFETLLEVFWTTHDPTTLNRQGADRGTQYRSVIFYLNTIQKEISLRSMKEVASQLWEDPIVTEVSTATEFYKAEDYHQNYYKYNSNEGYCQIVISPKLSKLRLKFPGLISK